MGNRTYCRGCEQDVTDLFICDCRKKGGFCLLFCFGSSFAAALFAGYELRIPSLIFIVISVLLLIATYIFCTPQRGEITNQTDNHLEVQFTEKRTVYS